MSGTWASVTSSRPRTFAVAAALLALSAAPPAAEAKVFFSRQEALELAFPEADRIESETYVLEDTEVQKIEQLAKGPLDSKLVKIYKGVKDERVIGYAVIDMHRVRTLPEAFLVLLTPEGTVKSLRVLAFHEPLDYLPSDRWYRQFDDKTLAEPIRLGRDVHAIVGATLSARATTRGVRRILAFYEVLIQNGQ
ncbi:MAG: FMN-binding protein [Myxococcota bacterium]|nr:FMN-binding protein [Myxococcota bacterium]